jgi:hypothetical protein
VQGQMQSTAAPWCGRHRVDVIPAPPPPPPSDKPRARRRRSGDWEAARHRHQLASILVTSHSSVAVVTRRRFGLTRLCATPVAAATAAVTVGWLSCHARLCSAEPQTWQRPVLSGAASHSCRGGWHRRHTAQCTRPGLTHTEHLRQCTQRRPSFDVHRSHSGQCRLVGPTYRWHGRHSVYPSLDGSTNSSPFTFENTRTGDPRF